MPGELHLTEINKPTADDKAIPGIPAFEKAYCQTTKTRIMNALKNLFTTILTFLILLPVQTSADWIWDDLLVSEMFRGFTSDNPMVIDPDNTYHTVFVRKLAGWKNTSSGDSYNGVFYMSKICEADWSQPEKISPDGQDPMAANILLSETGELFIIYVDIESENAAAFVAQKKDNGWDLTELPEETGSNHNLSAVLDNDGNMHIARMLVDDDQQRKIVYSNNISGEWEATVLDGTNPRPSPDVSLAVADDGQVYILYTALGPENERILEFIEGPASEPASNWSMSAFEKEGQVILSGDLQTFEGNPHIIVAFSESEFSVTETNIEYHTINNDEWNTPLPVNVNSYGQPLDFLINQDGNAKVIYREMAAYGVFGRLVVSKKEQYEDSFDDFVFEETESFQASEAFYTKDHEGNRIYILKEVGSHNLYALRSGECTPPSYTVTFDITDTDGQFVDQALITLGGVENEAGDYVFEDIADGNYSYTVKKSGFSSEAGELTVEGDDVLVEIMLTHDDVGIPETETAIAKIYPNPAESTIFIKSQHAIQSIILSDINGRMVMEARPHSDNHSLNVSHITTGLYLLRLETQVDSEVHKIHIAR